MKPRNTYLICLLLLCFACDLLSNIDSKSPIITIEEAVSKGFPIYLPSENILQSMGISVSPTVTMNTRERNCTYLSVDYPYENKPLDPENGKPAIKMLVSDGCAYPGWQGYPAQLSWAVDGKAIRVGEDFVDELPPIILFNEPTQKFQYVVFSEESLDNTMKLLESMTLVKPK
jgi:hypothetical protein